MAGKGYLHGTPEVWNEVFSGVDTEYSEEAGIQNQLFDRVKMQRMEEVFPGVQGLRILEVGCGAANASLYFAKRGAKVTCLDINGPVLNIAKKNFKKQDARGKFVVGNAEELPFKNAEFDVVMSHGLMEHFVKPEISFAEQVRVLRSGGLLFSDIVPARFSVQTFGNWFNFMVTLVVRGYSKAIRNFRPLYFENDYSWKKYKGMLEGVGLEKVQVQGNRPFARLSLPGVLDRVYTRILKLFLPAWKIFDRRGGAFARWWGAGWWFWGFKR